MSFIEQKFGEPLHPIVKQYFTSSRDIESWSKEHMRRYHEEAIRRVLEHAYKDNNFYREKFAAKGVRPDEFRSVEDIRKFPFITKDEMRGKPFICSPPVVPVDRWTCDILSRGAESRMKGFPRISSLVIKGNFLISSTDRNSSGRTPFATNF